MGAGAIATQRTEMRYFLVRQSNLYRCGSIKTPQTVQPFSGILAKEMPVSWLNSNHNLKVGFLEYLSIRIGTGVSAA